MSSSRSNFPSWTPFWQFWCGRTAILCIIWNNSHFTCDLFVLVYPNISLFIKFTVWKLHGQGCLQTFPAQWRLIEIYFTTIYLSIPFDEFKLLTNKCLAILLLDVISTIAYIRVNIFSLKQEMPLLTVCICCSPYAHTYPI